MLLVKLALINTDVWMLEWRQSNTDHWFLSLSDILSDVISWELGSRSPDKFLILAVKAGVSWCVILVSMRSNVLAETDCTSRYVSGTPAKGLPTPATLQGWRTDLLTPLRHLSANFTYLELLEINSQKPGPLCPLAAVNMHFIPGSKLRFCMRELTGVNNWLKWGESRQTRGAHSSLMMVSVFGEGEGGSLHNHILSYKVKVKILLFRNKNLHVPNVPSITSQSLDSVFIR